MSIKILNGIDVDNGVLYTDTTNDRVGVGTASPGYKLDVSGSIRSGGNYLGSGSAYTYLSLANSNLHHKFYTKTNTTAASERFTIEGGAATTNAYFSNVKVGIGTTSPSRALQVIGTDGVAKFYYNSSFTNAQYSVMDVGMMTSGTAANGFGPKITFRMGGNGYDGYAAGAIGTIRNGADSTHNMTFATSSNGSMATRMTITNGGLVGIGTTNPVATLDVDGSGPGAKIHSSQSVGLEVSGGGNTQDIAKFQNVSGSTKVTINHQGDVGIGTTSPSAKLEVNGDIALSGDNKLYSEADVLTLMSGGTNGTYLVIDDSAGNVGIGTTGPSYSLDVNGQGRFEQYLYLKDTGGTNRFSVRAESTYATLDNGSNSLNYNANNHLFLIGLSEKMRINSSGNVGIGTTAPGAKLEVNGNSRFIGEMKLYQGSTSNQYLNILQSGGNTFINTGTSGETIYFGAPASNTTNLWIQGTITSTSIPAATSDTDKFLVSDSGVIKYRTGAQLASDIGAVTGGPFLPLSGGTLTGDLTIPEYLYHSGDTHTNIRFQSDSISLNTGGWKVFENVNIKFAGLYGDNSLKLYTTTTGVEVDGVVKAVDGYKGYVSHFHNAGFFHSPRSSDGANPLFIPINSTGMSSSDQYYNTWVPLYAGRVRKIIIKHISGSTPTATVCTFRKKINGVLNSTTYAGTVTGGGAAGMKVTFDFGTSNFTFNAEDEVQIGIVTGVATQPRMGGCSCQIWYEYNIT